MQYFSFSTKCCQVSLKPVKRKFLPAVTIKKCMVVLVHCEHLSVSSHFNEINIGRQKVTAILESLGTKINQKKKLNFNGQFQICLRIFNQTYGSIAILILRQTCYFNPLPHGGILTPTPRRRVTIDQAKRRL